MNIRNHADSSYYKAPEMSVSLAGWLDQARQWHIEYGGYLGSLVVGAVGWVAVPGIALTLAAMISLQRHTSAADADIPWLHVQPKGAA